VKGRATPSSQCISHLLPHTVVGQTLSMRRRVLRRWAQSLGSWARNEVSTPVSAGRSCAIISQTISLSMPKYSCTILLRRPTIRGYSISPRRLRAASVWRLAASPTTSRFRTTASIQACPLRGGGQPYATSTQSASRTGFILGPTARDETNSTGSPRSLSSSSARLTNFSPIEGSTSTRMSTSLSSC
jgi:hypothetical protein